MTFVRYIGIWKKRVAYLRPKGQGLNQDESNVLENKKKLRSDSQLLQSRQIEFDLKNSALEKKRQSSIKKEMISRNI